jgi:hypothetical protein
MMAEMSREVPGGRKPMHSWEKWYWGAGVGGVSVFLFWRLKPEGKTEEQILVRVLVVHSPAGAMRFVPWEVYDGWGAPLLAPCCCCLWHLSPAGTAHALSFTGACACAATATRLSAAQEEKRRAAELEVKRKDHLRAVLAVQRQGGFIVEGDDPLDGLSPQQIEEFMAREGIDPKDPLEVRRGRGRGG